MPAPKNSVIAYLCAEFAIDAKIPTYAGGLGVLAGDVLKGASDLNLPFVGIGLLYKGKYFNQKITQDGLQIEENAGFDPNTSLSMRRVTHKGKPLIFDIFLGQEVFVAAYQVRLGENTTLYFLTTDIEENSDDWRYALEADYCCGADVELRQQFILGLGGVRLLKTLGINPLLYHFNEGRPCFAIWEIAKLLMEDTKVNFEAALVMAREKIVYTNHTLLPSGNLIYDLGMVESYAKAYATKGNINWELLLAGGIESDNKSFGITRYALASSKKASAVSKLHYDFCRKYWPQAEWTYITNGVHMGTWQKCKFADASLTDSEIWQYHLSQKDNLLREVLDRTGFGYQTDKLVVGWGRRVADYKRFDGVFSDIQRLAAILKHENRQVQILFAGKAHIGDTGGMEAIQKVIRFMQGELSGNAIFIPNYDMELALKMVSGVDVWLNTPVVGKEACGTSGMKALANGVINLSTADGWVAEADFENSGWILDDLNLAESFYRLLESDIVPMFYERNAENLPINWIKRMRNSIELSKQFDITKALAKYQQMLYL